MDNGSILSAIKEQSNKVDTCYADTEIEAVN